ncbi:uncharacterized protein DS421_7g211960 [Arachis hypogaea]|nr:uncharacterized protein DS421_7g211960 [Arachis hypogaea]
MASLQYSPFECFFDVNEQRGSPKLIQDHFCKLLLVFGGQLARDCIIGAKDTQNPRFIFTPKLFKTLVYKPRQCPLPSQLANPNILIVKIFLPHKLSYLEESINQKETESSS